MSMTTKQRISRSRSTTIQSHDWLRLIGLALTVLGLLVAGYMAITELSGSEMVCPGALGEDAAENEVIIDCEGVQNSVYAKLLGIPIAIIGIGGYLAIGAVWLLKDRVAIFTDFGHLLVFGMALFGFLYSAYLTYIEFFVIYKLCTWCLSSAALMTGIFLIAIIHLVQYLRVPVK